MKENAIYINGREIDLSKPEAFWDRLRISNIGKSQFDKLTSEDWTCSRIVFHNDKLAGIDEVDEHSIDKIELGIIVREFARPDSLINVISYLTPSTDETQSNLGGVAPPGFEMPAYEVLACPFQYIGRLNRSELGMEWMPFNHLCICYPLYTGIGHTLYFDYSEPYRPRVINADVYVDHVYGTFASDMYHQFETVYLEKTPLLHLSENQDLFFEEWYEGIIGAPFWMQAPRMPKCPKSGRTMQFVAQFTTCDKIRASDSTMVSELSYFEDDASKMSFWGGGSMYIFMEPETKIIGIYIQNT